MPPLPGMELGPPPPPAPRDLPKGFAFRQLVKGNIATVAGACLLGFGGLFTWAMLVAKPIVAVIPGCAVLGGFFIMRHGLVKARRVLRAFREGVAVQGKVASVMSDRSMTVNGQHPLKLIYHFVAEGQEHEGALTSFDRTTGNRLSGQPLWVLHVKGDPAQCTLYPPMK
jgi:hypothetical protein